MAYQSSQPFAQGMYMPDALPGMGTNMQYPAGPSGQRPPQQQQYQQQCQQPLLQLYQHHQQIMLQQCQQHLQNQQQLHYSRQESEIPSFASRTVNNPLPGHDLQEILNP